MIMKLTKSLLLMCASLGLFACSNEEIPGNGSKIEGPVDIAVKINLPSGLSTKTEAIPTTDKKVTVNVLHVTLKRSNGDDLTQTIKNPTVTNNACTVTFTNVEGPQSLSVEINKGTYDEENDIYKENQPLTGLNIKDIQTANAPMKGEVTSDKFMIETDENGISQYKVNVTMEHEMARLEFSNISHKDNTQECKFSSATLSGVLLNNINLGSIGNGASKTNYTDADFVNNSVFSKENPWDGNLNFDKFLTNESSIPGEDKCFAYNILPVENDLPILTVYFTNVKVTPKTDGNTNIWPASGRGYAIVSQYKLDSSDNAVKAAFGVEDDNNIIKKFPAGYIYQVTDLQIADENIHTTPEGNGIDLVATITVTPWETANGTVEWK